MTLRTGLVTAATWAAVLGFTGLAFINSALQISLVALLMGVLLIVVLAPLTAYATWAVIKAPTPAGVFTVAFVWFLWAPLVAASVYFVQDWLRTLPV